MATKQLKHKHPLAEVFGFKTETFSKIAKDHRERKLCPHNNGDEFCTKNKKKSPLGVCTIFHRDQPTIICPVRFREDWKICEDAAEFFFDADAMWTPVTEVRLKDKSGEAAGNIDIVLVKHDKNRKIIDFGAVEVQGVYVSGNIRRPFEKFMKNPEKNYSMDWTEEENYPSPDYLSSSRKRLIPQILYKGQILQHWGKKQAIVIDRPFYDTLPHMPQVSRRDAELCWLVYKMDDHPSLGRYKIELDIRVLTGFEEAMKKIGNPEVGEVSEFISVLDRKLSTVLDEIQIKYNVSSMSELLKKNKAMKSLNLKMPESDGAL